MSDVAFCEIFDTVDECVLAALDEGVARVARVLSQAAAVAGCETDWRERVGAALSAVLVFLDEQPAWARFLLGEPPVATVAFCERRQRALDSLAAELEWAVPDAAAERGDARDESWGVGVRAGVYSRSSRLAAELLVGGVFAVVRGQLLAGADESFVELVPSLMAFIEAAYQGGTGGDKPARARGSRDEAWRVTYRTRRVLDAIDASPRSSNREIADAAGLADEGQTSKLLSRLEQRGLVQNVGLGQAYGEPNAWLLTGAGRAVLARAGADPAAAVAEHDGNRARGAV